MKNDSRYSNGWFTALVIAGHPVVFFGTIILVGLGVLVHG